MGERMRALDWTKTPLGRVAEWPQSLKTIVRVMLDSRYAMWMLWGPNLTFFCNGAYLPTVAVKRDWVLGARSDKVWEEIWPDIGRNPSILTRWMSSSSTRSVCRPTRHRHSDAVLWGKRIKRNTGEISGCYAVHLHLSSLLPH